MPWRDFVLQPMIPSKRFDIFPSDWRCPEGLDAFRFFFKLTVGMLKVPACSSSFNEFELEYTEPRAKVALSPAALFILEYFTLRLSTQS